MYQDSLQKRWINCCANCSKFVEENEIIRELKILSMFDYENTPNSKRRKLDKSESNLINTKMKTMSVNVIFSSIYNLNYRLLGTVDEHQLGVCDPCSIILKNLYTNLTEFNEIRNSVDSFLSIQIQQMNKILAELASTFSELTKQKDAETPQLEIIQESVSILRFPENEKSRMTPNQVQIIQSSDPKQGGKPLKLNYNQRQSQLLPQVKLIRLTNEQIKVATRKTKYVQTDNDDTADHTNYSSSSSQLVPVAPNLVGGPSKNISKPVEGLQNRKVECQRCHLWFTNSQLKSHSTRCAVKVKVATRKQGDSHEYVELDQIDDSDESDQDNCPSIVDLVDDEVGNEDPLFFGTKSIDNQPKNYAKKSTFVVKILSNIPSDSTNNNCNDQSSGVSQQLMPRSSTNPANVDRTRPTDVIPTSEKPQPVAPLAEYLGDNYDLVQVPVMSDEYIPSVPSFSVLIFRPTQPTQSTQPPTINSTSNTSTTSQPTERQMFTESLKIDELSTKADRFYCRLCNKMWNENGQEFFLHLSQHSCHTCKLCPNLFFLTNIGLSHHLSTAHPNESQLECPQCNRVYLSQMELNCHLNKIHSTNTMGNPFPKAIPFEGILDIYKCNGCDVICSSQRTLWNHLLRHHQVKKYDCPQCSESFVLQSNLTLHMQRHAEKDPEGNLKVDQESAGSSAKPKSRSKSKSKSTPKSKSEAVPRQTPFKCKFCDKTFPFKSLQMRHERRIHTRERPYSCPIEGCGKTFIMKDTLKKHKLTHEPQSNYECPQCPKQFTRESLLKNHEKYHDSTIYPFECSKPNCGRRFRTQDQLEHHMTTCVDGKKLPCLCTECGKSFPTNYKLKQHQVIHTGVRDFKCDFCEATFLFKKSLKSHVSYRHEVRTINCTVEGCKKRFSTERHRDVHVIQHQQYIHLCNVCGRSFMSLGILNRHMKTHSGKADFECEFCQLKFASSTGLKYHLRIHTNEKPHKCSHCGKEFRRPKTLQRHLQIHTKRKPYKCEKCEKAFADKRPLKKHMLTHSEKQKFVLRVRKGRPQRGR